MFNIKKIEIYLIPILGVILGISIASFIYLGYIIKSLNPKDETEELNIFVEQVLDTDNKIETNVNELKIQHDKLTELTVGPLEKERLDYLKNELSLNEIEGDGVLIVIQPSEQFYTYSDTVHCYAPYLRDIKNIISIPELEVRGFSINGQRLSYKSTINCIGSGISIDFQRVVPPIEIEIVGNQRKITNIINTRKFLPSLWTDIENGSIDIIVENKNNIFLRAFKGNIKPEFVNEYTETN